MRSHDSYVNIPTLNSLLLPQFNAANDASVSPNSIWLIIYRMLKVEVYTVTSK